MSNIIPVGYASEVRIATGPDGKHTLLKDGKPYLAKGANWPTIDTIGTFVAAGGNSIRTYADEVEWMLPLAREHGLTIMFGLHIGRERQGFDYQDVSAIAQQREAILDTVRKYKDQPEILAWAIGNEPELQARNTVGLWKEVNVLARLIRQEDPNHPIITVVAGFDEKKIRELLEHCPELDALGVNWYGTADQWPENLLRFGWKKPYFITEFGPLGYWKAPNHPEPTEWGAPVEQNSTEKAKLYSATWRDGVAARPGQALGGYAFIWSTKQERTHTWFSMTLPDGERLGAMDAMQEAWTGKPVANPAPIIESFAALEAVGALKPGQRIPISLQWKCNREVSVSVDIRTESQATQAGGDREPVPEILPSANWQPSKEGLIVQAPEQAGNYRVFIYLKTKDLSVATANLPIRVVP